MAFGKHRRKKDPQPGDAGRYEELTPEQKAASLEAQYGRSVVRAADKRVKGQGAYSDEPTSTKKRFGRRGK